MCTEEKFSRPSIHSSLKSRFPDQLWGGISPVGFSWIHRRIPDEHLHIRNQILDNMGQVDTRNFVCDGGTSLFLEVSCFPDLNHVVGMWVGVRPPSIHISLSQSSSRIFFPFKEKNIFLLLNGKSSSSSSWLPESFAHMKLSPLIFLQLAPGQQSIPGMLQWYARGMWVASTKIEVFYEEGDYLQPGVRHCFVSSELFSHMKVLLSERPTLLHLDPGQHFLAPK